jgi:hypothetical protein
MKGSYECVTMFFVVNFRFLGLLDETSRSWPDLYQLDVAKRLWASITVRERIDLEG